MYGPWIPIYGFGGSLHHIFFLNRFKSSKSKLIIFTMLLCGVLEYFTSLVLDFAMNASYWNYKKFTFNLNGRICLAGLTAFAIGGFAGVYLLGPTIKSLLRKAWQEENGDTLFHSGGRICDRPDSLHHGWTKLR